MNVDEYGAAIKISDPPAEELARLTRDFTMVPDETVERLPGRTEIFGDDLCRKPFFCRCVKQAFRDLCTSGGAGNHIAPARPLRCRRIE